MSDAESILRRLVIAWDADQPEFDDILDEAHRFLGFEVDEVAKEQIEYAHENSEEEDY